jgi:hypothetical protein
MMHCSHESFINRFFAGEIAAPFLSGFGSMFAITTFFWLKPEFMMADEALIVSEPRVHTYLTKKSNSEKCHSCLI